MGPNEIKISAGGALIDLPQDHIHDPIAPDGSYGTPVVAAEILVECECAQKNEHVCGQLLHRNRREAADKVIPVPIVIERALLNVPTILVPHMSSRDVAENGDRRPGA